MLPGYRIINRIGTYTSVYLARDQKNVKVIYKLTSKREIDNIKKLLHSCPEVLPKVRYAEYVDREKQGHLIMEFCSYDIERALSYGKHIDKRSLIINIAQRIQKLHDVDMAHCDIKLGNIVDCCSGIKLIDFETSTMKLLLKEFIGTPEFMAPEIIKCVLNGTDYDPKKCDIWALGICIYCIIVGKSPWDYPYNQPDTVQRLNLLPIANRFESVCRGKSHLVAYISVVNRVLIPSNVLLIQADLLNGLLSVDPNSRMSIQDVLNHPYLREK